MKNNVLVDIYMSIRLLMFQSNNNMSAQPFKVCKLFHAERDPLHEVIMRLARVIIPDCNHQLPLLDLLSTHLICMVIKLTQVVSIRSYPKVEVMEELWSDVLVKGRGSVVLYLEGRKSSCLI